jgi:trimethylamine:corrinoid methyltransferase-like protein
MRFTARLLSDADRERVHGESLRILAEVGIRFHGTRALPLLRAAGASVDEEAGVARIPAGLVADALALAPRSFVLGARNPAFDFAVPSPVSRFAIDGTAAFAVDFETGQRRYGTAADIRDSLRVFQAIDEGVMAWAPTAASDTPGPSRAIHEFLEMARWCSKHGEHELHRLDQVPYLVDGLRAIAGSDEALRARHPYSLIYCPVAPLTHDGPMLDAYIELGALDLPVMIMPMPVTGTTGPASLFGTVCQANAEALSAIVVYQLGHPGRPLVYSSATGSADFRTGGFLGGTPEMGLQSAALTEMGRHYGLPASAAGCTSDAREPGPEAVIEKILTTIPPVAAGADIVIGLGCIEGDQALYLEQLLVDAEVARLCERLVAGIDPAAAGPDLLADIAEVGPGGHFLAQQSTRRAVRSGEFFVPRLIDRHPYEAWQAAGRPSLYANAREEVRRILAGPIVDPLPDDVSDELDRILAAADRELRED